MTVNIFTTDSYKVYYDVDKDMVLTDGLCEQAQSLKKYYSDFKSKHYDRFINILGLNINDIVKKRLHLNIKKHFEHVDFVELKLIHLYYEMNFYTNHVDHVLKEINSFNKKYLDTIKLYIYYDEDIKISVVNGPKHHTSATTRYIRDKLDITIYKQQMNNLDIKDLQQFLNTIQLYGVKHYQFKTDISFLWQ